MAYLDKRAAFALGWYSRGLTIARHSPELPHINRKDRRYDSGSAESGAACLDNPHFLAPGQVAPF